MRERSGVRVAARRQSLCQRATRAGGTATLLALAAALLAACAGNGSGGGGGNGSVNIANSQGGDPATVDYPIFYVKRPVPTDKDGTLVQDDLRILREIDDTDGADLYMRASASPSAAETNITSRITAGAIYNVKDVDTSADGSRVVFAMRGPLTKNQKTKNPPSWRIWQYVIATDTLAPVINPAVDPDPLTVNDVSPHYLPDGRIVFSSTRQTQSQGVLLDEHDPQFSALDEARQRAGVRAAGHERRRHRHPPDLLQSEPRPRCDRAAERARAVEPLGQCTRARIRCRLYTSNPDGTDLQLTTAPTVT